MSGRVHFGRGSVVSGGSVAGAGSGGLEARQDEALSAAVQLVGVAFFALCTGWAAAVRIPLPFTPVPITMQTFAVLMSGAIMGRRLGAASMLIYLLLGCAGMPFFSGMRSGFSVAFGPTGGYLIGFMAAAWIVGRIAHVRYASWKRIAAGVGAASAAVYICGMAGLLLAVPGMGVTDAFMMGVVPFLPGDMVKAAAAAGLVGVIGSRTGRIFPREE